jgi:hypothetical protein
MHHYTKFYGATLQDLVSFILRYKDLFIIDDFAIKTREQQPHARTHTEVYSRS